MKPYLERWPELKDFLLEIDDRLNKAFRPAAEVILDDVDLRQVLKISKRQAAKLRAERLITYFKNSGKIYYRLSDVITYATKNKIPAIYDSLKFK
jgi:hypothetical protein